MMQISADLFRPFNKNKTGMSVFASSGETYWSDAWTRLKSNKVAVASFVIIAVIILAAVIGPEIIPYKYSGQIRGEESQWPNPKHSLGTDSFGRDMLARILYGGRISLSVGLAACLINLTIGVLYGGISGYAGGKIDNLMTRIVDIIYSIPTLLYIILLSVVFRDSFDKLLQSGSFFTPLRAAGSGLISICLAIFITILAFNLFGDGLRDALDPRMRK